MPARERAARWEAGGETELTDENLSDDVYGIALDADHPLGAPPPARVTDLNLIYTSIEALLDAASTNLTAGTAFPFPLGSGFAGFDTPATFLKFNRALRARVSVYHQKYAEALTALNASFIDDSLPFKPSLGVYHAFGAGSGDLANELNTTDILAHPSIVTEAKRSRLRRRAAAGSPASTSACRRR